MQPVKDLRIVAKLLAHGSAEFIPLQLDEQQKATNTKLYFTLKRNKFRAPIADWLFFTV